MTNYMTKESLNKRIAEHYEKASEFGTLYGVFLKGSQNYIDDLFFEGSDVDSVAVIIPTEEQILLGKETRSATHTLENGEQITPMDLRKFFEILQKPGVNNYEVLFTEYFKLNSDFSSYHKELLSMREEIVRADEKGFLMATMGISHRDFKTMTKKSEGSGDDVDLYGYSRKRLSNILRFNATAKAYLEGKDFENVLKSMPQEEIHEVRRTHKYNLEEALELAEKANSETKELAYNHNSQRKPIKEKMDNLLMKVLKDVLMLKTS